MQENQNAKNQISQTLALLTSIFPSILLLDFDQVAQVLNTSKSACYIRSNRAVHGGGDFPAVTKIGSRSLVKLTDLAEWIDQKQAQPKAVSVAQALEKEPKKRGRPTKREQLLKMEGGA